MADRPLSGDEAALWARVLETVRPLKVAPKPVAKVAVRGAGKPNGAVNPGLGRGPSGGKVVASGLSAARAAPGTPEQVRGDGTWASASASALFQKLLDLGVGSSISAKRPKQPTHPQPSVGSAMPPAWPEQRGALFTRHSSREGSRAANTLDGSWDRKLTRGLISPDCAIDLHGHNLSTAYATLDGALEQSIRMGDRVVLLVTGKPPRPESERPHARGAIRAAIGDWLAGSRHAAHIAAVRGAHPRHGGAGALYIILRRPAGPSNS